MTTAPEAAIAMPAEMTQDLRDLLEKHGIRCFAELKDLGVNCLEDLALVQEDDLKDINIPAGKWKQVVEDYKTGPGADANASGPPTKFLPQEPAAASPATSSTVPTPPNVIWPTPSLTAEAVPVTPHAAPSTAGPYSALISTRSSSSAPFRDMSDMQQTVEALRKLKRENRITDKAKDRLIYDVVKSPGASLPGRSERTFRLGDQRDRRSLWVGAAKTQLLSSARLLGSLGRVRERY